MAIAFSSKPPEAFPGPKSDYHGFDRYDFDVDGCKATVVTPKESAAHRPWIWRAEFFDHRPELDLALLGRGFHLVFIEVGNTFGAPNAMKHWDVFYDELTKRYGLSARPTLEGLSRGGLYIYNWAAANPKRVSVLYGDNPVCDFKSWPGGKGKGPGSPDDWAKLQKDYGFRSEAEALAYTKNPVDNLAPLAKAHVPIIHCAADADEAVPYEENTVVIKERYEKLGGHIEVIVKHGFHHHPHGLDDPTPLVEFILAHTDGLGAPKTAAVVSERGISSNQEAPSPFGALPSKAQLRWHAREVYAFLHFTVNTFTDREWGFGDEDCSVFNPTSFDADQIVTALKAGGMKAAILTCKHHDGFCLWPTKTTDHSVAHSSWRGGTGNVVREISEACARHGLEFGIYVSPWDRNNPHYGMQDYVQIYRQQLRELLTDYGPICEVWHDGANGGDGYYGGARETRSIDRRVYYGWPETWAMVRKLQPNAVIFSDIGPDIRWVGNESGYASETCWATYDPVGEDGGAAAPGYVRSSESGTGTAHGKHWLPAECDVSIRPGWFWHEKENGRVRTPANLVDLYYKSIGRGASFLLNVPPDRRGQLNEADVESLARFGQIIKATFKVNSAKSAKLTATNVRGKRPEFGPERLLDGRTDTYWATDNDITVAEVTIDNTKEMAFNVVKLKECVALGQRVDEFALDTWVDGAWKQFASGTSIGSCRIVKLAQTMKACTVRLRVVKSSASLAMAEFGLYHEPA